MIKPGKKESVAFFTNPSLKRPKKYISAMMALIFLFISICPAEAARDGNYGPKTTKELISLGAISGAISLISGPIAIVGDIVGYEYYCENYSESGELFIQFSLFGYDVNMTKQGFYSSLPSLIVDIIIMIVGIVLCFVLPPAGPPVTVGGVGLLIATLAKTGIGSIIIAIIKAIIAAIKFIISILKFIYTILMKVITFLIEMISYVFKIFGEAVYAAVVKFIVASIEKAVIWLLKMMISEWWKSYLVQKHHWDEAWASVAVSIASITIGALLSICGKLFGDNTNGFYAEVIKPGLAAVALCFGIGLDTLLGQFFGEIATNILGEKMVFTNAGMLVPESQLAALKSSTTLNLILALALGGPLALLKSGGSGKLGELFWGVPVDPQGRPLQGLSFTDGILGELRSRGYSGAISTVAYTAILSLLQKNKGENKDEGDQHYDDAWKRALAFAAGNIVAKAASEWNAFGSLFAGGTVRLDKNGEAVADNPSSNRGTQGYWSYLGSSAAQEIAGALGIIGLAHLTKDSELDPVIKSLMHLAGASVAGTAIDAIFKQSSTAENKQGVFANKLHPLENGYKNSKTNEFVPEDKFNEENNKNGNRSADYEGPDGKQTNIYHYDEATGESKLAGTYKRETALSSWGTLAGAALENFNNYFIHAATDTAITLMPLSSGSSNALYLRGEWEKNSDKINRHVQLMGRGVGPIMAKIYELGPNLDAQAGSILGSSIGTAIADIWLPGERTAVTITTGDRIRQEEILPKYKLNQLDEINPEDPEKLKNLLREAKTDDTGDAGKAIQPYKKFIDYTFTLALGGSKEVLTNEQAYDKVLNNIDNAVQKIASEKKELSSQIEQLKLAGNIASINYIPIVGAFSKLAVGPLLSDATKGGWWNVNLGDVMYGGTMNYSTEERGGEKWYFPSIAGVSQTTEAYYNSGGLSRRTFVAPDGSPIQTFYYGQNGDQQDKVTDHSNNLFGKEEGLTVDRRETLPVVPWPTKPKEVEIKPAEEKKEFSLESHSRDVVVPFLFDEHGLSEAQKLEINEKVVKPVKEAMEKSPDAKIEINVVAEADAVGPDKYNDIKGAKRLETLMDYLNQQGIPESFFNINANYGESRAFQKAIGTTNAQRETDRWGKIEVTIETRKETKIPVPAETKTINVPIPLPFGPTITENKFEYEIGVGSSPFTGPSSSESRVELNSGPEVPVGASQKVIEANYEYYKSNNNGQLQPVFTGGEETIHHLNATSSIRPIRETEMERIMWLIEGQKAGSVDALANPK